MEKDIMFNNRPVEIAKNRRRITFYYYKLKPEIVGKDAEQRPFNEKRR